MANLPALVLDLTIGQQRRVATTDVLYVGGGIDRAASGALTIGNSANTTSITIGTIGVLTTIAGNLQVDGTETVVGTTTFQGDTNIGNDTGDTLTITGDVQTTLPDNMAGAFTVKEGTNNYILLGTLDAGATMAFGNATTNPTISLLGTGQKTIAGNLDATGGIDVTGAVLSTAVGITNSAGEVLVSGGNFQLNDTIIASFGSDDDLQIVHSGAAGSITNATGALKIENNAAAANIVVELGDNAAATNFVINDSDSVALVTVDSNGVATFAGNVNANAGLDVAGGDLTATGGAFTFTGTNVDLDPTGHFTLDMDATKLVTITIADNLSNAFRVQEGANAYINVTTTDAGEAMTLGNATTNPTIGLLGTGQKTVNGNLDATGGIDVTGAVLTTAVGITNTAGEVLVSGGNVQLNDSIILSLGTGDDFQFQHNGTNSLISVGTAGGDLVVSMVAQTVAGTVGNDIDVDSQAGAPGTAGAVPVVAGAGGTIMLTGGAGGAGDGTDAGGETGGDAGAGGAITIYGGIGGAGEAGTVDPAQPGNGAAVTIVGGAGGAGAGTSDNSTGGNVIINGGDRGTGGSGAAGVRGQVLIGSATTSSITLGNATTNPELNFLGTGEWNLNGAPGTSGQVFTSNGPNVAPTWQTLSGTAGQLVTSDWDTDTNAVDAGMVAAYTTTADRATKADATSASGAQTCIGICKVRHASTGEVTRGGRYTTAKFIAALTLNNGNRVFVSKTAGSLTNDVSAFTSGDKVIPVGWVRDNGAYAGSGVADIELDFGEPVTL